MISRVISAWKKPAAQQGRVLKILMATLSVVFALGATGATVPANTAAFRDGVVLVGLQARVGAGTYGPVFAAVGAVDTKTIGAGTHVLRVPVGSVTRVVEALSHNPIVRYAEPDYLETLDGAPNDPSFGLQWALQNTGQTVNLTTGTAGADENVVPAWSISTGSYSTVVAIVDSGVQYNHPDLEANMWGNPGGVNGCPIGTFGDNVLSNNCDPMDDDTTFGGHGTHIAGIIGATGNNQFGVAGENWNVQIMAVKWVPSSGTGATSDLISALQWVVAAKQAGVNVRVINDSATWKGTAASQALSDEIDVLGSNDILFVTAAGNTADNNDVTPRYPCVYDRPNQICVAASDQNDNLWSSSNYGVTTVDLAAPGANIYSTKRKTNFGYISGGSMATAQVSGAAALLLSTTPSLSTSLVKSAILNNVDQLPSLNGLVATGGRLDVCQTLTGSWCSPAPTATPVNTSVPTVGGMVQFGHQVGVATGLWTGYPSSFSYQWTRCDSNGDNCAAIPGAAGSTYAILANTDVGSVLRATVTAINDKGSAASDSAPTAVVQSAPASSWSVSSTILDGSTLSGKVLWQATPSLPSTSVNNVQFFVDGILLHIDFSSAYTYNLDVSALASGPHVLAIRAVANDLTTATYSAVVTAANPPTNTGSPVVSGTAVIGDTLTTSDGTWFAPPTSVTYQWNRCDSTGANCAAIAGATNNTYLVAVGDVGSTIRSAVTGSNQYGSTTVLSNPTALVQTGQLTITTTSLPSGTQNVAYSTSVAASGGSLPYSWSITTGTLPSGLSLNSSTGAVSGTPTSSGTSNFTVKVTDAQSQTATQALSLTVAPAGGGGSITLLQSAAAQGQNTQAISQTFPANSAAGDLLIVFVRISTTTQNVIVTDSAGNAYALAVTQAQSSDKHQTSIFYAVSKAAGAITVTATFSGTNASPWMSMFEYSGISALDATAHAEGKSTSPSTGLTGTTTSNQELVFTGVGLPSSSSVQVAPGTGYTLLLQNAVQASGRAATEGQVVGIIGQYEGMFSLSGKTAWSAVMATFK